MDTNGLQNRIQRLGPGVGFETRVSSQGEGVGNRAAGTEEVLGGRGRLPEPRRR